MFHSKVRKEVTNKLHIFSYFLKHLHFSSTFTLNLATYEEALAEERKYSKHRNSASFHEYEEQKRNERAHIVKENSDLIDVTKLMKQIDSNVEGNFEKI